MENQDTYRFQVNLSGMINILSNHLYSNPKVYLRELLQNGVDAITARQAQADEDYIGQINIEVNGVGAGATLIVEDNGIGLNEAEVHEFLAMIGQSSKRGDDFLSNNDSFIGRFGIGLLSCFMVSDEIVMLTQSAKGGPALEWRGKPDGTYTIRKLEPLSPGTKVYLRCKAGCEVYFDEQNLQNWLYYYGALLPYPIILRGEEHTRQINPTSPVWVKEPLQARNHREEVLAFGEQLLGERFRDFIPLQTSSGRTGGIAFILPHAVNLNAKRNHRVYLKHMLVSEAATNILPDWTFFVKCLVWTDELQPTASREHFYENEKLEQVREELGDAIRKELISMAEYNPERLQAIIHLHALSMKALAVADPEFYSIIHAWLPFETTFGTKSLGDLISEHKHIYFTATLDEYRQITHVASAQSMLVVNGGYIYDAELLSALPLINQNIQVERLLPEDVSLSFTDVTAEERMQFYEATRFADSVLQKFRCQVQLRRFKPEDIPVLYTLSEESASLRSLEAAKETTTDVLSSVLGSLGASFKDSAYATLYFNLNNPVVEKVFNSTNRNMIGAAVEMLYCNALMMGHYPMSRQEMALLNQGIVRFIDWGMSVNQEGGEN